MIMHILLSFPMLGIITFLLFLYISRKNNKNIKTAPEAAGAWPVIGHLHRLSGPQLPHKTLGAMADIYGPIFTIKIGLNPVLVVSDMDMAKECFTTNDKVFANRTNSIAAEVMGYNTAMFALSPYGPYWTQVRKMVNRDLLSNSHVEIRAHIRVSEVKSSIREMYEFWVKSKNGEGGVVKMEMKKWFGGLIVNIVVRMLAGKRFSSGDEELGRSQQAMRRFLELMGAFVVGDVFPCLRWLDLGGFEKAMKHTAKEMDDILQGWLEEHKTKRREGRGGDDHQQDLMGVMLSNLEGEDLGGFDADTVIKSTFVALLAGAADTTIVSLTWALSLILNHPHVLKRAQDELHTHVGRERQVEESDIKNLVYLNAIVKETLRVYPPAPLAAPHSASEDCVVGGYNISKGTRLLPNVWKIHRDPRVWSDPYEFQPERFLTSYKDVDVRGQHFELLPFGTGRRVCPGISLALEVMQLTLANLIHGFELTTFMDKPIDMSESFGLTNFKATPLDVFFTPRLSPHLYEQVII